MNIGVDAGLKKEEMLKMIRFGADKILAGTNNGEITDEDVETILARSKTRSEEFDQMISGEVVNFTMDSKEEPDVNPSPANNTSSSLYIFEGEDYR